MKRATATPGIRGSRSGRPIMVLFDLLGRRWTLRVLWELRTGPMNWRELRAACGGVSPNVLQQRLDELREAGLLGHTPGEGYELTPRAEELAGLLYPLNDWAKAWAAERSDASEG